MGKSSGSRKDRTSNAVPAHRALAIADLFNVAFGRRDPRATGDAPLAAVNEAGEVLTRAEAARVIEVMATISNSFAMALPETERTALLARWESHAIARTVETHEANFDQPDRD